MNKQTNEYNYHTLNNGLRIIFRADKSPVTYCGLAINTGSRDELPNEYGMAHFIEHMLFKGTQKRRSAHIINRLENVGGELNAYTSKEETVVYAGVLTEYSERAIELIADITLHSVFPQKEIDKEVVIIMDEIQSYNDSPSELIYDDFEELLFEGNPLAHNILGSADILNSLTTADARAFVDRQYRADGMVLFVTGNLTFRQVVKWAEIYYQQHATSGQPVIRTAPAPVSTQRKVIDKNTHQVHFLAGTRTYNIHHPNRMGLYLLNNIVGGPGMSSLLNMSLREKNGLVYNVESSFQPFTDTGIWTVYFGCDPENAKRCEDLVYRELNKLREKPISESSLKKYKLQLQGQMAIASENKEHLALSLGKSYLRYNKVDDQETIRQEINKITASQLHEIACEVFKPENLSTLIYR